MYNYKMKSLVLHGQADIQRGEKAVNTNWTGHFLRLYKNTNKLYLPLFVWLLQRQDTSHYCRTSMLSTMTCTQLTCLTCLFYSFHSKTQYKLRQKAKWIENILTPSTRCQGFRGHVLNGLDIWWSNIKIETPVGFFKTEAGRKRSRSNPWNPCRNIIKKSL